MLQMKKLLKHNVKNKSTKSKDIKRKITNSINIESVNTDSRNIQNTNTITKSKIMKSKKNNISKVNNISKIKKERNISIRSQLITVCILFSIVPVLCVSIISGQISKGALSNTTEALTKQMLLQVGNNLNSNVTYNEEKIDQILQSDFIESGLITKVNWTNTRQEINRRISYREEINQLYDAIAIILEDGTIFQTKEIFTEELVKEAVGNCKLNEYRWEYNLGSTNSIYLVYKSSMNVDSGTSKKDSTVTIITKINSKLISDTLGESNLLDNSVMNLYSLSEDVLYSSNNKAINQTYSSKDYEVHSFKSDSNLYSYLLLKNGWSIMVEIPEASLTVQLESGTYLTWMIIVGFIVLAIFSGIVVAKRFSLPILQLQQLMKEAEEGNLTVQGQTKSRNELGRLMNSFNHMLENIRHLIQNTRKVTSYTWEESQKLNSSSQDLAENFKKLSTAVSGIADGATSQSEDIQTCSESTAYLSESIEQVVDTTKVIYDNNQAARTIIEESSTRMQEIIVAVRETTEIASRINKNMMELNGLNKNINGTVSLLEEISEQTSLLSLNASIEAARAGDAGRGFGVVASEVRNLAERSQESTVNVKRSMSEIEDKIESMWHLVTESNRVFQNQETIVNEAYESFTKVIEALRNMDIKLDEIILKTDEMKKQKEDTTMQIANIAAITEEFVSTADEVNYLTEGQQKQMDYLAQLSDNLNEQMKTLENAMGKFHIE